MKTLKKKVNWKDKFIYFGVPSYVEIPTKPEGDTSTHKLNSKFEEGDLMWASVSQAQFDDYDNEGTNAPSS